MLPNFIIIGAMKCGTTSLAYYLSQHPDVFVSNPDVIDFFSNDAVFDKGLEYYESFFEGAGNAIAIGEGSDDYTKGFNQKSVKASARIKELLPDCKLIYLVKHPLRQIESSWLHRYASSREKMPFNEAVIHSPFNYVETANYKKQLDLYLNYFPKDQIKVLFTEDMAENPRDVVEACFTFLQVSNETNDLDFSAKNVSSHKIIDRGFTKMLRNIPMINKLGEQLPPATKEKIGNFFTRKLDKRPEWNKESFHFVKDKLWDDSLDFLDQHGKEKNFWSLSDYQKFL
ncbi:MAG: sulfotransferase family protein [Marinilabiliaceae bacterium]